MNEITRLVDRRPVTSFFILAYAISWVLWLPVILGIGDPYGTAALLIGSFGPAIAGGLITWLDGASVRAWLKQIIHWRIAPQWYAIAFVLPLLVVGLASVGIALLRYEVNVALIGNRGLMVLSSFIVVALVGGGNEEPGWRGFALPKLQERYSPVKATLLLGVVWAFWHLPLLPVDTSTLHGLSWLRDIGPSIVLRILNIMGFAFLLTWVYNGTESVLLAILTHAGFNTANSTLIPLPMAAVNGEAYPTVLLTVTVAVWIVAVLLVASTGGRLGYQFPASDPERSHPRENGSS